MRIKQPNGKRCNGQQPARFSVDDFGGNAAAYDLSKRDDDHAHVR